MPRRASAPPNPAAEILRLGRLGLSTWEQVDRFQRAFPYMTAEERAEAYREAARRMEPIVDCAWRRFLLAVDPIGEA